MWGYREVRTSTVDYFDIIRGGAGEGFADSIFKVQDWDGRLLSMRGEVTTQVARMLASKAKNEGRIFYIANCIRFLEAKTLSQREFWQAGTELIGGKEAEADAEVIALTLGSLEALGLKEASVDVGNVELFRTLSERFRIGGIESLRKALASKSASDLSNVTTDRKALDALSFIMKRRGGPEVLRELSEMVGGLEKYTSYFDELYRLLEAHGCASRVSVDLTTLREMKYYNGTVFDVFVNGLGVPIGGGGRYDTMMKEFGLDNAKATGFAVSVDLCVRALDAAGFYFDGARSATRILYKDGFSEKAIFFASELRLKGITCTVDAYGGEMDGILVGKEITDIRTGRKISS
jgi:ATP phosphoribosyltransferase regulatory subunit